jgi:hypothetical protein
MIKAIETSYAGCRFRSRLEARWAVALDHLGIEWEYEPEGFETSVGRYLPDFRLNTGNAGYAGATWLEVKPDGAPHDPRHDAFAKEAGVRLVVASGMCRDYRSQYVGFPLVKLEPGMEPQPVSLYVTPGRALLLYLMGGPATCPAVDRAYAAARSARFEHGESGSRAR